MEALKWGRIAGLVVNRNHILIYTLWVSSSVDDNSPFKV